MHNTSRWRPRIWCGLLFLILGFLVADAGQLRQLGSSSLSSGSLPESLASSMTSKNSSTKVRMLPSECDICGPSIVDPFQNKHDYCQELSSQCTCCRDRFQNMKADVCRQFWPSPPHPRTTATCVDGIKAAIEEKKARCKQQQDLEDHNQEQQRQKIRDELGYDPFELHATASSTNTTYQVGSGPFDEACDYGDPNCKDVDALCDFHIGCNNQLGRAETDYRNVESWYGMLQHGTPCFSR